MQKSLEHPARIRHGLRALCLVGLLTGAMSLTACGGGGDSSDDHPAGPVTPDVRPDVRPDVKPDENPDIKPDPNPDVQPVARFSVAGKVAGLQGHGLVLQNNGGDDLAIAADGSFRFAQPVASGAAFAVSVKSQPSLPTQTCTVNNGAGIVGNANVDQVRVTCSVNAYQVAGTVSGLGGGGLVLQNNGGDTIDIDADGRFVFPKPIASGASYAVSVVRPGIPAQRCDVLDGSGVMQGSDIPNVRIQCAARVPLMAFVPMSGRILRYTVEPASGALVGNGEVILRSAAPKTLVIDPLSRFAYGLTSGSNQILIYPVDQDTGSIKGPATIASHTSPYTSAILHPSGKFFYAADERYKLISAYRIDANTGELGVARSTTTEAPRDIAIDSLGRQLYALDGVSGKISTFSIDAESGALALQAETALDGPVPARMVLAPSGRLAYVFSPATGRIGILSIEGGRVTQIGQHLETGLREFVVHPNGKFAYLTNSDTATVKSFAIGADGGLTEVGQALGTGKDPAYVSIDPSGRFLYVTNEDGPSVVAYAIDPVTGALSSPGGYPYGTEVDPAGVAFSWR